MFFKSLRLKNAYKVGRTAYKKGKHLSENPYIGRFSKSRRKKNDEWKQLIWAMIDTHELHKGTLAGQWNLGWQDEERSKGA